jgi:hypothetical protein
MAGKYPHTRKKVSYSIDRKCYLATNSQHEIPRDVTKYYCLNIEMTKRLIDHIIEKSEEYLKSDKYSTYCDFVRKWIFRERELNYYRELRRDQSVYTESKESELLQDMDTMTEAINNAPAITAPERTEEEINKLTEHFKQRFPSKEVIIPQESLVLFWGDSWLALRKHYECPYPTTVGANIRSGETGSSFGTIIAILVKGNCKLLSLLQTYGRDEDGKLMGITNKATHYNKHVILPPGIFTRMDDAYLAYYDEERELIGYYPIFVFNASIE